jgi:hypothetical protein
MFLESVLEQAGFSLVVIILGVMAFFGLGCLLVRITERIEELKERLNRRCIYCGRLLLWWGAEHFWCGIKHPHLSIPGTVSHVFSVISRPIPPISDFFISKRDFAEGRVKKLGKKRRERRGMR